MPRPSPAAVAAARAARWRGAPTVWLLCAWLVVTAPAVASEVGEATTWQRPADADAGAPAAAGSGPADDPVLSLLRARSMLDAPAPAMPSQAGASAPGPAAELVLAAMNFLDTPYRWGGTNAAEGFDCSGFTRHVFATALGLALPRRSAEQARAPALASVARGELQPGDLVFFNTLRQAFSHVGLYIGDGRFVHAPRRGEQVRVESLRTRYWASRFDGARRVVGAWHDGPAGIVGEPLGR